MRTPIAAVRLFVVRKIAESLSEGTKSTVCVRADRFVFSLSKIQTKKDKGVNLWQT